MPFTLKFVQKLIKKKRNCYLFVSPAKRKLLKSFTNGCFSLFLNNFLSTGSQNSTILRQRLVFLILLLTLMTYVNFSFFNCPLPYCFFALRPIKGEKLSLHILAIEIKLPVTEYTSVLENPVRSFSRVKMYQNSIRFDKTH